MTYYAAVNHVWVYIGEVTDVDGYDGKAVLGQPEYQFSYANGNSRDYSADYIDLELGLREHSGYTIHWRG